LQGKFSTTRTVETITSGLCPMNTIYETGVPTDDTHLQQVTPTS